MARLPEVRIIHEKSAVIRDGINKLTYGFSGHPSLNLTAEEKRVYGNLLKEADPDGFGAVSGDVAVKFFERTRLPPDILGQVRDSSD